ncbi:hypothetical protein Patl1_11384 [Pistacia atlantica]|uniref:Uncharacterized protein n=1 Tax=Pistacia atlantica TaxID=434234 RepID=A0ACC1A2I7_9ROSI|nr:hypothetical protein Patl1_11384 [Pistacia atlantica]
MSELQEENSRQIAFGWAATDSSGILHPFHFTRRANGHNDITIKILYCGICHSDLHLIKNDFGIFSYPIVPGHEIVGVVTQVGSKVQKFKVRDKAGVGGSTIFDDGGDKNSGMHVGVVGLGGLGHLAVKFAKALGMKVTVISTSPGKKNEAIQHLEADSFIVSYDMKQMQAAMESLTQSLHNIL